jgi:EAL domain-containing protein (putative c-di-GMP-specific phosphodiesterase class I)
VTETVIEQSVNQLRIWLGQNVDLGLSVNMSPLLVNDLNLPTIIGNLMHKHHVDRSRLTLEITESAALAESQIAVDILARLRILGIGLAIDDFGTGNSSLLQLFRMPFNELKIDRSFIAEILESEEARRIVQATVDLAHSLGLKVCAEGVESVPELEFLQTIGCDMVQGYLISRPLPAEKIGSMVHQWNQEPQRGAKRSA